MEDELEMKDYEQELRQQESQKQYENSWDDPG